MNDALNRQSLSDQIRKALIQQIIAGKWKPGEHLVEKKLAEEFQTSQTPVRRALHDLEAMRMVESAPHRGVRVRKVTEAEMAEAYSIRGLLEEEAALFAAPQFVDNVGPLRQIASETERAAAQGDAATYAEHDYLFHRTIVEASNNATMLRLWNSLAFEFRTPLMMLRHPPNLNQAAAEHLQVVDALEQGNGGEAGRLLRRHAESFIPSAKPESKQR